MDDLLREFLTETGESLDTVDVELVHFEQEPNNAKILDNIFRLVHTIKGTCGFLGLPRLEALAHAAETLMGKFRDGMPVTGNAVTLILSTIDRIKQILDELEKQQHEPAGVDSDLIGELERLVVEAPVRLPRRPRRCSRRGCGARRCGPACVGGIDAFQELERPLRVGEVAARRARARLPRDRRPDADAEADAVAAALEAKFAKPEGDKAPAATKRSPRPRSPTRRCG